MIVENKKIAVIGGGPGGLTVARLLQKEGIEVKVYERDADQNSRQQGSTLDLHYGTGLKALETAGLMDEFKKYYRPGANKAVVVSSNMDILFDEHEEKSEEGFGDEYFRPEIDRAPLRNLLIDSLTEGSIVWDSKFSEMKPSGTGWEIFFENGTSAYADLVVGADGANSKLRRYVTDIPAVYSGVTSIEGNIYNASVNAPKLWKLVKGGSLFALENGRTICFITKGDGTLTFLIGLKRPENWLADSGVNWGDRVSVTAWFKKEFSDWSRDWEELFSTDSMAIVPRPWYHFPSDQHWEALANLTIIGDAAHRIPAYAGEGANQALADAVDLYEALCYEEYESIQEAIASFEQKMFKRSAVSTEESLRNTEGFHTENNLQFLMNLFGRAETPHIPK
ncbi:2-polyprenyl-6-methoxyphenol hydroxylase-like FAD-dependent oxidoreductase [Chryseobacterium sp. H1D6B]|uniref:FAD-dependent oxidoreductase n=1 Tax=Chryseobacterium sp. H1D6B TaxID=2940588 RepID=UPI0015CCE51F|nr:NAD(P)/FAD-dependent oxidoreductase [Chryseobacterium sp. H1D6B]MDH6253479.1 2-polyprenyl-6-methoxyphenol hydroxylase-like FAD-dependent oxidoreductase [Chryseobacterium sp. H1D6B]